MVVMIIESDFAIGHDFSVLRKAAKLAVPRIVDVLHFVGMHADGRKDVRMLIGKRHGRPAGGQIASDRHECFDAGLPRSVDHGVAVAVEPGIVEMGMGINEHAIPERKDLNGGRRGAG